MPERPLRDVSTSPHPELLRSHGLHVTAQRLAVLEAVSGGGHRTADDIDEAVRSQLGSVSRQAVYDALGAFTGTGLVRRVQPAGSPARFEQRVGDNHHHLVCRECHRMVDVDCVVGEAPCLTAVDSAGFEIDEAEVIFWGRCPDCAAAGARRGRAAPRDVGELDQEPTDGRRVTTQEARDVR